MSGSLRIAILTVLGILVIAIMVYPYFGKGAQGDFAVTQNPAQALAEVKGSGKPVVLEFYADW